MNSAADIRSCHHPAKGETNPPKLCDANVRGCTSPRSFEAPPGASVPWEAQLLPPSPHSGPTPEPQTCGKGSPPNSVLAGRCCVTCAGDKLSVTWLWSCLFNNKLFSIRSADSRNAGGRAWILKSLLLEVFNWLLVHPSSVCSPGSARIDPTVPLSCTVSACTFKLILGVFICTL